MKFKFIGKSGIVIESELKTASVFYSYINELCLKYNNNLPFNCYFESEYGSFNLGEVTSVFTSNIWKSALNTTDFIYTIKMCGGTGISFKKI